MKTIVIYYSLEGNTAYVADIISDYIHADTLRLETAKELPKGNFSKYFWGGKSVIFGQKPKLLPYHFDVSKYDTVIIGTPVWAGSYAAPLKTFLHQNNLSGKNVALYACSAGPDNEKCFIKLQQEIPGCHVIATLNLVEPRNNVSEENTGKIREFCDKL